MSLTFKIVKINPDYCDYLRKFDNKVYINSNNKSTRPFIGVLFSIGNIEYYAPLTSPKPKHQVMKNTLDFLKLDNGNLGAINFNNMIPVTKKNYTIEKLNKQNLSTYNLQYQNLEKQQLIWLNSYYYQVKGKAQKLYNFYNSNKLADNIKKRCCNFPLLEEKCKEWEKVYNTLPILNYIKDEDTLFYIYDNLSDKNNFDRVIELLDNDTFSKDITTMNIKDLENKRIPTIKEFATSVYEKIKDKAEISFDDILNDIKEGIENSKKPITPMSDQEIEAFKSRALEFIESLYNNKENTDEETDNEDTSTDENPNPPNNGGEEEDEEED